MQKHSRQNSVHAFAEGISSTHNEVASASPSSGPSTSRVAWHICGRRRARTTGWRHVTS